MAEKVIDPLLPPLPPLPSSAQALAWPSFETVAPLPPKVQPLIEARLSELEEQHGRELVSKMLGYAV